MDKTLLELKKVSVAYASEIYAVKDVSALIEAHSVTSIIGLPGAGKTSLLRSINRLHELHPSVSVSGEILLRNSNIFEMNPMEVRRRIGMIFPSPNPFPQMNISENVLSGYMLNKMSLSRKEKEAIVEENLHTVDLWDEVKNCLHNKVAILSAGQQQLLCIARALALKPDLLLMDDPTSTVDVVYIKRIEDLIYRLKDKHAILIAARNLSQATRISDYAMYMEKGELVEYDVSRKLLINPNDTRTEKYVAGEIE